ncbi:MAG: DMT family transporter, partial [Gammaproteobacteria bacterium]|nr:DMT family transporter [Gammaproteobacteria bacterium]
MSWLLLSLISAFCLASADAATKRFIHYYRAEEIVLIRFGLAGLLLLPLLLSQNWPQLTSEFWLWLAALLPIELLAMRLYMEAIRSTDLSLTVPLLAFTPVFYMLTGYLILDETIQFNGLVGISFVVFGSWILNLQTQSQNRLDLLAPFKSMMMIRGSRLMLCVAVLYSLTSVFSKGILRTVSPDFFGVFYMVVLGLITVCYLQVSQC